MTKIRVNVKSSDSIMTDKLSVLLKAKFSWNTTTMAVNMQCNTERAKCLGWSARFSGPGQNPIVRKQTFGALKRLNGLILKAILIENLMRLLRSVIGAGAFISSPK
jgi:hypothetical protein